MAVTKNEYSKQVRAAKAFIRKLENRGYDTARIVEALRTHFPSLIIVAADGTTVTLKTFEQYNG